ncbi:MAG: gliding motility-associated C-terminal domain-containing protein, partial [Chitinophagales bacterium]|nr:gliding motility-associated C-terminal domain-containing protein [Chitinophagales bacterium]
NLCGGNIRVFFRDANGCLDSLQFTIPSPPSTLNVDSVVTPVRCFGGNDGSIDLTLSGLGGPWTVAWSNGAATEDIQNLTAGCYIYTITDNTNCSVARDTICVTQPPLLAASDSVVNISCFGQTDGCIYINVSGGTPNYNFVWADAGAGSSIRCGLASGVYNVTVSDQNNCSVVLQNIQIVEPSPLTVSASSTPVSCRGFSDGTITAVATGGTPPYSYQWIPNAPNSNFINGLLPGFYDLTVTDSRNCTASQNDIFVNELPGITLFPVVVNVLCPPLENGAIYLAQSGAVGSVSYRWSNGQSTENISGLAPGQYSVTVSDSRNCTADTVLEVLNDSIFRIFASPEDTFIPLGAKVRIDVKHSTGTAVASYDYRPRLFLNCFNCSTAIAAPNTSLEYAIIATDTNGCIASDTVQINVVPEYQVYIPNAFSPGSNDDRNAFFEIYGNKEAWKQMQIQIFNRWGEKVYDTYDKYFRWDGTYKGKYLPPDVYVYTLNITWIDNVSRNDFKGSITLIR